MPSGFDHIPTPETRQTVRDLTAFGNTHEAIAAYLEISADTLVKHYRKELDTAAIDAIQQVAKRLYARAVEKDCIDAQKFYLRTRGGCAWREPKDESSKDNVIERLLNASFKKGD